MGDDEKQYKAMLKTGEIARFSKENSTFYDDENFINLNKMNKTSFNLKQSHHSIPSTIITQDFNNVRSLGMSEFQSTSSYQNSVFSWTFSKSRRFNGHYKKGLTDSIYNLPDNKNMRATIQGFGNRNDSRPRVGQCSPPPNKYKIKSIFEENFEKKKGKSISEKVAPLVYFLFYLLATSMHEISRSRDLFRFNKKLAIK